MRKAVSVLVVLVLLLTAVSVSADTEQEIIDKYLQSRQPKAEPKTPKIGWFSINFTFNRVNRHNDYNTFMTLESANMTGGEFNWIKSGYSLGGEVGIVSQKRFTFSFGGEYWLKMGQDLAGDFVYLPAATTVSNPSSKVSVYGAYVGIGWYAVNPPVPGKLQQNLSFRINGTVGYYACNWDLWQEYANLNLSTGLSTGNNTTFHGNAPGLTIGGVAEYPLGKIGLVAAGELQYLYLNFNNVAWYNSSDEEIIVSWDGTPDGRVDLGMSGFRGKFEIRKYFSW